MKIVNAYSFGKGPHTAVFISRGKAIDYASERSSEVRPRRVQLLIPDDVDPASTYYDLHTAYKGRAGEMYSPFATSEDFVCKWFEEAGVKSGDIQAIYTCPLWFDHYDALAPDTEFTVDMCQNDKGAIYCRIPVEPDINGKNGIGKMFFPDHKWENPAIGKAVVTISRNMDKYGFVVGKMADFTFDDLDTLLDVLWDNGYDGTVAVRKISGSVHGTYYMVGDNRFDGTGMVEMSEADTKEALEHVQWKMSINELILRESWNIPLNVENTVSEEIMSMYQTCEVFNKYSYKLGFEKVYPRDGSLGEAVANGFIVAYLQPELNLYAYEMYPQRFYRMSTMQRSEIEGVMKQVVDTNVNTTQIVYSKMRKGKLRIPDIA